MLFNLHLTIIQLCSIKTICLNLMNASAIYKFLLIINNIIFDGQETLYWPSG